MRRSIHSLGLGLSLRQMSLYLLLHLLYMRLIGIARLSVHHLSLIYPMLLVLIVVINLV